MAGFELASSKSRAQTTIITWPTDKRLVGAHVRFFDGVAAAHS